MSNAGGMALSIAKLLTPNDTYLFLCRQQSSVTYMSLVPSIKGMSPDDCISDFRANEKTFLPQNFDAMA